MDNLAILVLFLAGITAGSEAGSYFFLRPAKSKLPPQQFIELEKYIQDSFGKIMPILMIVTTIAVACLLLILWPEEDLVKLLSVFGLLGYVVANGVTIAYMLPINNQTARWDTKSLPSGWRDVRDKWERIQGIRTWSMMLAFAFLCAAVTIQLK
jgi:uncharacterized membrane protein